MRNPFLAWVIICSLYSASITRTFKFSTRKKSYFTYREAVLFMPASMSLCMCKDGGDKKSYSILTCVAYKSF